MPNAVLGTWSLSLQRIEATCEPAITLLGMICFFDHRNIHASLMIVYGYDEMAQREAIAALVDYSLVSRAQDLWPRYTMHRLVQVCTRAWLEQKHALDAANDRAILLLGAKACSILTQTTCAKEAAIVRVLTHVPHALSRLPASFRAPSPHATLALIGFAASEEFTQSWLAFALVNGGYKWSNVLCGKHHEMTLVCLRRVADIFATRRQYALAETILNGLIATSEALCELEFTHTRNEILHGAILQLANVRTLQGKEIESLLELVPRPVELVPRHGTGRSGVSEMDNVWQAMVYARIHLMPDLPGALFNAGGIIFAMMEGVLGGVATYSSLLRLYKIFLQRFVGMAEAKEVERLCYRIAATHISGNTRGYVRVHAAGFLADIRWGQGRFGEAREVMMRAFDTLEQEIRDLHRAHGITHAHARP